jgi:5-methylcytosine-specific restriction endonuclease McrA
MHQPCLYCGNPITSPNLRAVYCGRKCKERAKQRRDYITVARKPGRKAQCGTHSGYVMHRKRGEQACAECLAASAEHSRRRRRAAGIGPKPSAANPRPCMTCGRSIAQGSLCPTCRSDGISPRPCADCGTGFTPKTLAGQFCSAKCLRRRSRTLARELGKEWIQFKWSAGAQACYQRRRALIKGATVGERIIPADVYDRDGWLCGICGDPVDRSLSYPDPMSKSLDHIVPVSRGGAHALTNVQCSHLRCNISKSDRLAA